MHTDINEMKDSDNLITSNIAWITPSNYDFLLALLFMISYYKLLLIGVYKVRVTYK